jgi:KDO2-lipid IV(A) lauroyltransferase
VPRLPRETVLAIGRGLGRLGFSFLRRDRRVALANLDAAYGDTLSPRAKRRIARASFEHFGQVGLELFWSARLDRRTIDRIVTIADRDVAMAKGHLAKGGAIVLASHAGNWEILNIHAGYVGIPVTTLARRLRNAPLNALVNADRTRSGNEVVYHDEAARGILRALRAGRFVAIPLDQNTRPDRGGIYVPFFGLDVAASRAVAMFALKTGVPIIPVSCRALRGGRYRAVWDDPIPVPTEGDRNERERELTRRCVAAIEASIRDDPGGWLWQYRRFKYRPTTEQGRFPFYSKHIPEAAEAR